MRVSPAAGTPTASALAAPQPAPTSAQRRRQAHTDTNTSMGTDRLKRQRQRPRARSHPRMHASLAGQAARMAYYASPPPPAPTPPPPPPSSAPPPRPVGRCIKPPSARSTCRSQRKSGILVSRWPLVVGRRSSVVCLLSPVACRSSHVAARRTHRPSWRRPSRLEAVPCVRACVSVSGWLARLRACASGSAPRLRASVRACVRVCVRASQAGMPGSASSGSVGALSPGQGTTARR
ncbi:unnamed protein product [Protopolystoma xenopodis]|uniref:Uncharacterized protein n=1 Tax=Protopolystoma xenopodis TaxID=117903 RepID=A0A448X9B1_9PLAT|nr:unnamed protein product [Protopolystoma xenopodis]